MINGKKVLAVIPARGGSKGIPRKNIKSIAGKPLIAWTIETAKKSKYIDRLICSSDDLEIIGVAKEHNCEVPFIRPAELAVDTTSSIDVILHALDSLEENYDICIMLEPTSPLRETEDIDQALEKLISTPEAESIVGIAQVESQHPVFIVKLDENNFINSYLNNNFKFYRRQEIDELFYFEGSMYISFTESLRKRKSFYHEKCLGHLMPKYKAFEIDDETDLLIIETLLNHYRVLK